MAIALAYGERIRCWVVLVNVFLHTKKFHAWVQRQEIFGRRIGDRGVEHVITESKFMSEREQMQALSYIRAKEDSFRLVQGQPLQMSVNTMSISLIVATADALHGH